ncbi:hypothetical protein P152DRAFT_163726 [Eremomyces bilateralis CBS 781.70]|uniref:M protein, serotype 2.1 n=1 Tax=Eremomyces bilateralis CBS 781.70 TaxID=1392243 RepID=A0A6G1FUT3_9PEZI|nr:uncharacterized protein P152DRAFT_163726 [Eremomyces bilateralis CBS 781.70]KAF1809411.1 hypothetical protein P152DRAFT_163726 [Eremomyces bilateralis CBS 781.70]
MSSSPKKPPGGTNRSTNPSQKATSSSATQSPGTPKTSSSNKTTSSKSGSSQMAPSASGVSRTKSTKGANGSPLSARASVKKPGSGAGSSKGDGAPADNAEEDSKLALIEDLKERLQHGESVTEELQKQVEVLQARLDESIRDQSKLEERAHEEEERNEGLENDRKELVRQRRELDSIYEAERASMMKEKEEAQSKEDEMHETIQRLKDALSQRDLKPPTDEGGRISRTASFQSSASGGADSNQFAPSASLQRSNSRNNSKILLQKDKVIESLRLELAEVQIKLVEMENMGGGRLQDLEKSLLEARMTNARLMEDNESFQLLLSEKTLNGDFAKGDFMRADEDEDVESDKRRLESEIQALKEQNKALTLYINKIIDRVLQHQGYEAILSNAADPPEFSSPNIDKDLPPPPPAKDAGGPSLLQRAKSVAMGATAARPRPRPVSYMPPAENSINSDPTTAPSIPLGRTKTNRVSSADQASLSSRRNTVDFSNPSAASVVHNMFRASSPDATPGSPAALASPRNSFFAPPVNQNYNAAAAARLPSGAQRASSTDRSTGEVDTRPSSSESGPSAEPPSPPRSVGPPERTMTGKGIKPLRLVRENAEAEEAARKAANRGSWMNMGWFQRGQGQGPSEQ